MKTLKLLTRRLIDTFILFLRDNPLKSTVGRYSKRITIGVCLLLAVVSFSGLHVQDMERRVSGIITSQSGELLPGVSVAIKGTTETTISDVDGRYAIMVSEDAVLQFNYIGFESLDIAVESRSVINVTMEDMESKAIKPAMPIRLTEKQAEKASADNGFSFKLFREVSKLQGSNTFFSPFSLNMAMGMLYNGSSGKTRTEMTNILDVSNLSESGLNEYYRKISQDFLEMDLTTEIVMANAIWCNGHFSVKEDFIETGKKYFDADVGVFDFNEAKAIGIINSWCSNKTRGRINNIVADPIQGDMCLTNAIYFKGKWQREKKFNKEYTKQDEFIKSDNSKNPVNMMEQTIFLPYYSNQYLQCVELPYGNQAFSMIAILPPEKGNVGQLIEYLSDVEWDSIVSNMEEKRVWLKMPRFRMECELILNESLMNVGMGEIFKGDFLNIADTSLVVSDILQKTFLEVNEEGTEAAAATAVQRITGGAIKTPDKPVRFFANRPFLCLIREKSTGVILFIGRVDDPRE